MGMRMRTRVRMRLIMAGEREWRFLGLICSTSDDLAANRHDSLASCYAGRRRAQANRSSAASQSSTALVSSAVNAHGMNPLNTACRTRVFRAT